MLAPLLSGFGQGSLSYQNTGGVGKEKYVFLPDPSYPLVARNGGTLPDYVGHSKVEGPGFYAQLWWALGEDQPENCLMPVPGSVVTFRTGSTAGLINGKSKLEIPGTFGGDLVTLQLRVWNNLGGTLNTWEEAKSSNQTFWGLSGRFNYMLSGVARDGTPVVVPGNMSSAMSYFSIPVPEPGLASLLTLGLGGLAWRGRRRPQAEGQH